MHELLKKKQSKTFKYLLHPNAGILASLSVANDVLTTLSEFKAFTFRKKESTDLNGKTFQVIQSFREKNSEKSSKYTRK